MVKDGGAQDARHRPGDRRRQPAQGQGLPHQQRRRLQERREDPAAAGLRDSATPRNSSTPSTRRSPRSMDRGRRQRADLHAGGAGRRSRRFPIEPAPSRWCRWPRTSRSGWSTARDGVAYVLRLHRPGYHTLDELISERAWLRALADAGIAVPTPVRARDGRDYASGDDPGHRRTALRRDWRAGPKGRVLAEVLARNHRQRGGRALLRAARRDHGRDAQPGQRWQPPATFTRHALDADGLMGEHAALGAVLGPPGAVGRRAPAAARHARRACMRRSPGSTGDPSVYSMIHADMHPGNVLVDGDAADRHRLRRRRLRLAPLRHRGGPGASAGQPDTAQALERAFLDGYRPVRPISDADRDAGPDVPAGPRAWRRSAGITSAPSSSGRPASTR